MNNKILQKVKGGAELYGALLELDGTKTVLECHIEDLKIEISSSRKALKSVKKRYQMGAELYKKHHGREVNLKQGKYEA